MMVVFAIAIVLSLAGVLVVGYVQGGFLTLIFFAVGATVGASLVELRRAYKRGSGRIYPKRKPDVEYGSVRAYLDGQFWECHFGSRVFRAYSHIEPADNHWVTEDGVEATPEERVAFINAIEAFRGRGRSPWPREKRA